MADSSNIDVEAILARAPGRSPDLVRRVEKAWRESHAGKRIDHEVALWAATQFGLLRVVFLCAQGPDVILLSTLPAGMGRADNNCDTLYIPVEQCSFMIQHFKPTTEQERIVVGFGPISKGTKDENNNG